MILGILVLSGSLLKLKGDYKYLIETLKDKKIINNENCFF